MLQKIETAGRRFPNQFWVLAFGSLLSSTGAALVWPFLTIYLRERLDISVVTLTSLFTLNSAAGLVSSLLAGPITDRFGRKWILVLSLASGVIYYVLMTQATALWMYALLLVFWGAFSPLYAVSANAMVADLVEAESRSEAYALIRVIHNVGVAAGPIAGGILIAVSYQLTFYSAAVAYILFTLVAVFAIRETLPPHTETPSLQSSYGFSRVFADKRFMSFIAAFVITSMSAAVLFLLLPMYAKENYGVLEGSYSYILAANAVMCIFLQYSVTRITVRYDTIPVLCVGALFYAVGVGSIALGQGFWAFLLSMVITTMGELIMTPAATTLAANLAPADMRGRYMGVYNLAWPIGAGIGPVVSGLLSDRFSPRAIWYGGGLYGLISAAGFLIMWLYLRRAQASKSAQIL